MRRCTVNFRCARRPDYRAATRAGGWWDNAGCMPWSGISPATFQKVLDPAPLDAPALRACLESHAERATRRRKMMTEAA